MYFKTCGLQFPEEVESVGRLGLVSVDDERDGEGDDDSDDHEPCLQVVVGTVAETEDNLNIGL